MAAILPTGLLEELALERHAVRELELHADLLWKTRRYRAARQERLLAAGARERVAELESILRGEKV